MRGGPPRVYTAYPQALPDLEDRLGPYCSYCELPEPADHVEHVAAKVDPAVKPSDWSNLLLACPWCNGLKTDQVQTANVGEYVWPDRDNTARAFVHRGSGRVDVAPELAPTQRAAAERTLALFDLNRALDSRGRPEKRWCGRQRAWAEAKDALSRLGRNDTREMREQVVCTAAAIGFWSVWVTVFATDADMLGRLTVAFAGTWPEWHAEPQVPRGQL